MRYRAIVCLAVVAVFLVCICGVVGAETSDRLEDGESLSCAVDRCTHMCGNGGVANTEPERGCVFKKLVNGFFGAGCTVNYRLTDWILGDTCDAGPMKEPF
ncbi:MAG: hypothetical protein Kow0099_26920 [Candidatus Abyssubacteria bacterium]